jgi:putative tryptophan/tyrosine transport system substrate-binding protein
VVVRAQQPARPVIGLLNGVSFEAYANRVAAFRQGLKEAAFVEGQNVPVEYRSAEGRPERLPALAADLVRRQVGVIVAIGGSGAAQAAKAETARNGALFPNVEGNNIRQTVSISGDELTLVTPFGTNVWRRIKG